MTPDIALRIVDLIIDDQWTAAKRREFVKLYGALATSDAEGLARRSRGEAEPQTAADRAGKRQAWLDKVEATRLRAMVAYGPDESKPNLMAQVACLKLEGTAEMWLGAASGKAAPADHEPKTLADKRRLLEEAEAELAELRREVEEEVAHARH